MQILFLVKDNFVAAGEFIYHLVLQLGLMYTIQPNLEIFELFCQSTILKQTFIARHLKISKSPLIGPQANGVK